MLHARRGLLPDGLVRTEMAEGASIDAKIFADENPVVKALQLSNYKQLMQPLPQEMTWLKTSRTSRAWPPHSQAVCRLYSSMFLTVGLVRKRWFVS